MRREIGVSQMVRLAIRPPLISRSTSCISP